MSKKKNKKAKAVKPAKKVSKPAAKKTVAKKPVKKVTKPVKKTKPMPKAKAVAAKTKIKKAEVKKTKKKEVKKIVSKEKEIKPKKTKLVVVPTKDKKSYKKSEKQIEKENKKKGKKGGDADHVEGEELDIDTGLLEIDPEAMPMEDEEIEEVVVEENKDKDKKDKDRKGIKEKDKKYKRRRSRGGRIGMKKHYDSEEFVRKQVIKIDLTKSLIKKPKKEEPKPFLNSKDARSRYNDKELKEFKEILVAKLNEARTDYDLLKQTLTNTDNHGTDDTSPTFKLLEDGSDMLSKEEVAQLASRQEKYIVSLQNALVRIQNKTYGICRVTGRLIPKERLRSVPHATLSMNAKINQYAE